LLSAIGHVTAGLAHECALRGDDLSFVTYLSSDGVELPSISDYNFMALKGRPAHLKKLRDDLLAEELPAICYTNTMLEGGSEAQQRATSEAAFDDLEILALASFGDHQLLSTLTKRFSLWRP